MKQMFSNEYLKNDGSPNIMKLSRETDISRSTLNVDYRKLRKLQMLNWLAMAVYETLWNSQTSSNINWAKSTRKFRCFGQNFIKCCNEMGLHKHSRRLIGNMDEVPCWFDAFVAASGCFYKRDF